MVLKTIDSEKLKFECTLHFSDFYLYNILKLINLFLFTEQLCYIMLCSILKIDLRFVGVR